jgi:hypothetical protein
MQPQGQKNDFRDAEAIAEAVQRPAVKFMRVCYYALASCTSELRGAP